MSSLLKTNSWYKGCKEWLLWLLINPSLIRSWINRKTIQISSESKIMCDKTLSLSGLSLYGVVSEICWIPVEARLVAGRRRRFLSYQRTCIDLLTCLRWTIVLLLADVRVICCLLDRQQQSLWVECRQEAYAQPLENHLCCTVLTVINTCKHIWKCGTRINKKKSL